MAWPKLTYKSSGPLMTSRNRSGAAQHGARSQENAAEHASAGAARGDEPVNSVAAGTGAGPTGVGPTGVRPTGVRPTGAEPTGAEPAGVGPAGAGPAEAGPVSWPGADDVADPEAGAEREPADLPLWDWSPPAEHAEPSGPPSDQPEPTRAEAPSAAVRAEPPSTEQKPVVTRV